MRSYFVYILSNQRRTVLYTGVTNNLSRRLDEHCSGKGSVFVKRYNATELVYVETHDSPRDAISREKEIKGWLRNKKLALIKEQNPEFQDLTYLL